MSQNCNFKLILFIMLLPEFGLTSDIYKLFRTNDGKLTVIKSPDITEPVQAYLFDADEYGTTPFFTLRNTSSNELIHTLNPRKLDSPSLVYHSVLGWAFRNPEAGCVAVKQYTRNITISRRNIITSSAITKYYSIIEVQGVVDIGRSQSRIVEFRYDEIVAYVLPATAKFYNRTIPLSTQTEEPVMCSKATDTIIPSKLTIVITLLFLIIDYINYNSF